MDRARRTCFLSGRRDGDFADFTHLCWRGDVDLPMFIGREMLSAMYEVDQNRDAYREGLLARALGRSCDGNPYPEHSREASLWIYGWWLIQDAAEIAPGANFEPSSPRQFQFDEVAPNFLHQPEDPLIRSILRQTVEATRPLLTGLLLAAAGFSLSYAVLRIFLL